MILFLIAVAWRLLKSGRHDVAAGCVLAIATTKPQLTGILVLGILCRSIVSRRWGVIQGFSATLATLCLVCSVIAPAWPLAMVRATNLTPLPHIYFPGSGCSWLIVLRTIGLRDGLLLGGYLLVAIPLVVAVLRLALDRRRRLDDLICLSLIATFYVAPYSRYYDLPIILIPALVLVETRFKELPACALLMALMILPYSQYAATAGHYPRIEVVKMEYLYFWIPLLISIVWWRANSGSPISEDSPVSG